MILIIAAGGGANGISMYGKYRFANANVQWKLPECSIILMFANVRLVCLCACLNVCVG